jgi:signal transduction histidine kinase
LVGNAIKFTEKGEVVVSVERVEPDEGTESMASGVVLRFCVRDTGGGLSEEHQARLFQKFAQKDASIARQFGGTGLGLAIARQTMEAHHGTISATSTVGVGTTVTLHLPVRNHLATAVH